MKTSENTLRQMYSASRGFAPEPSFEEDPNTDDELQADLEAMEICPESSQPSLHRFFPRVRKPFLATPTTITKLPPLTCDNIDTHGGSREESNMVIDIDASRIGGTTGRDHGWNDPTDVFSRPAKEQARCQVHSRPRPNLISALNRYLFGR